MADESAITTGVQGVFCTALSFTTDRLVAYDYRRTSVGQEPLWQDLDKVHVSDGMR